MSKNEAVDTVDTVDEKVFEVPKLSAKEMRAKIFAGAGSVKRLPFTFKGMDLEFIQPTIGTMYGTERANSEGKSFIVTALIENAVVPGTEDKVFEDTDYDPIMEMPMNNEMAKITKLITEMFGLNGVEEAKN